MQVADFVRVVTCFAESPAQVDVSKGEFVVQLRDELLSGKFERVNGALHVNESGSVFSAESWIVNRVARLPLLADRILTHIQAVPNFVSPSAKVLKSLQEDPSATENPSEDALAACELLLMNRVPGTTTVTYLTSDAGEGKTTLVNVLARKVAADFRARKCDWVLLPVPLGGNSFQRFDEVVIGALMNRLRFQYWFFEGFVELVRLGVVVPAFDGFEEMIVEGSSGEAVSALGNLMTQLDSEGTVLFAARKAFFEYQSFKTQARLFDAIGGDDSVSFARLSLERWSREQFMAYGASRGAKHADEVYEQVSARFGIAHPLLTRAVLVTRLFDVATTVSAVDRLLAKLGDRPQDYFHEFVLAIIEREAADKWPDKEGREGQTLLTVAEHLQLLASVAREMWISSSDSLRMDVLDIVADLFCEEGRKSPTVARQVRERIKTHALLVGVRGGLGVAFDHVDFKRFFTGVALGNVLIAGAKEDLRSFLKIGAIDDETVEEALLIFDRESGKARELVGLLLEIAKGELPTSFVLENIGRLMLRTLDNDNGLNRLQIENISFAANSLLGRTLRNMEFKNCYFAPTGLLSTSLQNVVFRSCRFERIESYQDASIDALFVDCDVAAVAEPSEQGFLYDPNAVQFQLRRIGFKFDEAAGLEPPITAANPDGELVLTERLVRIFLRTTQVNEATLRVKFGANGAWVIDQVVPRLLENGVLEQVGYHGSGTQRRFKLAMPMQTLQEAVAGAFGSFTSFLAAANTIHRAGQ
jgi:hypothetical protein